MPRSTRSKLLLLLLLLGSSIYCSRKSKEIYLARVDSRYLRLEDIYGGGGETPSPSSLQDYVSNWVDDELIYIQASKLRLDNDPQVKRQIEESVKQILVNAYIEKFIDPKISVSEREIEDYFATHHNEFVRERDEIHLRHILVHDEAKAKEVKDKLASGADFASIAKEYSEDSYAQDGGDLGYVSISELPVEIRDPVQKAKPGTFSGPIKSDYGFHFILVEDFKSKGTPKELTEVAAEIRSIIYSNKYESIFRSVVDSLKNQHKVEINESLIDSLRGTKK
jgi:parvulin-like peptidyl-prolyl isomerase